MAKISAHGAHELARHEITQMRTDGMEVRSVFVLRSDGAILETVAWRRPAGSPLEQKWNGQGHFSICRQGATLPSFKNFMAQLDAQAGTPKEAA